MSTTAPQIRRKSADEVLTATFGFANKLADSGAVLSGSPTVTVSPSGPTIGTPSINAAAITVDGQSHAIGEAVRALITGGTAGTRYTLTCTADTDGGETMIIKGLLDVT